MINKSKKTVTKVTAKWYSYQMEEISDSNLQIIVLDHTGPGCMENPENIK